MALGSDRLRVAASDHDVPRGDLGEELVGEARRGGPLYRGGLLLAVRNDAKVLADNDVTTGQVTGLGIGFIVLGVLAILLAVGLLKGSRISRDLIALVQLAHIAGGIYVAAKLSSDQRSSAIGGIGASVVVLFFLFGTDKAKAFFAKK